MPAGTCGQPDLGEHFHEQDAKEEVLLHVPDDQMPDGHPVSGCVIRSLAGQVSILVSVILK